MVVKMMRWRPWPPLISRKYEAKLTVHRLEGTDWAYEGVEKDNGGLAVEIRWKGPKNSLGSFRRTVKRNFTREEVVKRVCCGTSEGILVEWDEEFRTVCNLSGYKDNVFHPWEIHFIVFHGLGQGAKSSVVGSATMNIAEYTSNTEDQAIELKIPLTFSTSGVEHCPLLCVSLLLELGGVQEPKNLVQSPTMAVSPLSTSDETPTEKDEVSAIKAGLQKVKKLKEYVSTRRPKSAFCVEEGSKGRYYSKSDEDLCSYPFESDSMDGFEEGESDDNKESSTLRKSFSYGTLTYANYADVSSHRPASIDVEDECWVYYSNHRQSDADHSHLDNTVPTMAEQLIIQNSRRSILPWRKRKMNFRSSKAEGEPLLKKAYGEEGGDDIDFDRRMLSCDESLSSEHKTDEDTNGNRSSISEFGNDSFAVGTWEHKEIASRDGCMKIHTQVFFSSIDQRSERAAGESACTVLVAVIADWLQNNRNLLPIKSQFDSLIRDGSFEWRNLCEDENFQEQFPDKHFDLETVLQSKICDICVLPVKSFIGFFHQDGMEGEDFDFLHGAMSFDCIWDEIRRADSSRNGEAPVFIVSWNDHFFILKVETDAYYIIDTLGERLYEGCNQAYILKFDKETTIYNLPSIISKPVEENFADQQHAVESEELSSDSKDGTSDTQNEDTTGNDVEEEIVWQGKECCKEYIKNFLAAIPIRELQADIKKGLAMPMSTPLHQRLQIEFHFTSKVQAPVDDATIAESLPEDFP